MKSKVNNQNYNSRQPVSDGAGKNGISKTPPTSIYSPSQLKAESIQNKEEEEEKAAQGKGIQLKEEEEEAAQGKGIQMQEEEEATQGKF